MLSLNVPRVYGLGRRIQGLGFRIQGIVERAPKSSLFQSFSPPTAGSVLKRFQVKFPLGQVDVRIAEGASLCVFEGLHSWWIAR